MSIDNLNDTYPAAKSGFRNLEWQGDPASSPLRRISGCLPNIGRVDARTLTSEIVGSASSGKLVTFNNSGAVAALIGPSGLISTFVINGSGAGTGYTVGDVVTILAGASDAKMQVVATGGGGAVTALALQSAGHNYVVATGVSANGGTGTGLAIDILSVTTDVFDGMMLFMQNIGAGTVTVTAGSSANINGASSVTLPPATSPNFNGALFFWDGAAWWMEGLHGGSSAPTSVGLSPPNGTTGTNVGPMLAALHAGSLSKWKIVTKASDPTTDLTVVVKKNGTTILTQTVTHATSSGTVSTGTLSVTVAENDVFSIDVTAGTSTWLFTVELG